jgi:hypothetical protein
VVEVHILNICLIRGPLIVVATGLTLRIMRADYKSNCEAIRRCC